MQEPIKALMKIKLNPCLDYHKGLIDITILYSALPFDTHQFTQITDFLDVSFWQGANLVVCLPMTKWGFELTSPES